MTTRTAHSRTERIKPWSSFKHYNFSIMWAAQVTMTIAMTMRLLSTSQWIYDETGSAAQLGILGAVQLLQMPVVIYGGALADVMNRKVLMAMTQSVSFISLLTLTMLAYGDVLAPWHIWVVTGVTGMVNMLGSSARPAMLPRCVPRTHLTNAVTISTSTMQVAAITVPFIFAPIYLSWGIAPTLLVTTAIAGASVISPLLIRASGAPEKGSGGGVKWRTIVEGFHFVRTHPILPGLYLLDIGVTIVSFYRMLFPFFSHELYGMGAQGTAMLTSANALGGVCGSMVVFITERWRRKGMIVLVATFIYALLLFAWGFNRVDLVDNPNLTLGLFDFSWTFNYIFAIGLGLVALLGGTDAVGMTMRQALVQLTAPDHMLGRASSAHSFSAMGANHLGQMEVSFVGGIIGAGNVIIVGGFISVIVIVAIWRLVPGIRNYRYRPQRQPQVSGSG
ncbi:MAG: MFS transporter [Chloroflexi bacterium]|nr:MFS transporter [Chloroflexota bacterium]